MLTNILLVVLICFCLIIYWCLRDILDTANEIENRIIVLHQDVSLLVEDEIGVWSDDGAGNAEYVKIEQEEL